MTGIDLADEDAAFITYLAENGWEGEMVVLLRSVKLMGLMVQIT
jgi:hypothetical protein